MEHPIDIIPIERAGPATCCVCGGQPTQIELKPVTDHPIKDCPPDFDCFLESGQCPLCGMKNCFLEICVVPGVQEGQHFFNDRCWEGRDTAHFIARAEALEWQVSHFTNVREVSLFQDGGGPDPLLTTTPWLDQHLFYPFTVSDVAHSLIIANAIAARAEPYIRAIRWPP